MKDCIGQRKLFLFLLITAVVNADRIKEASLACDINVRCVALDASFHIVSCEQGFFIRVINAHYGYYDSNRTASESCSIHENDCLESVPLHSKLYYIEILYRCNGKERCDYRLVAKRLDGDASCDQFTENDYVSIQFYCVPSDVNIETESVCASSSDQKTISCTGQRVIQIVGAILGFQDVEDSFCTPRPYTCRIQPDLDHLEGIRSTCQGKNECDIYAATSLSRVNHTCNSLKYTFETVTYYCTENSGTLVSRSSECGPTSAEPSTVPLTSVEYDSLATSSTTGDATISSEASTYTMVDNLGNVSTTVTDTTETTETTDTTDTTETTETTDTTDRPTTDNNTSIGLIVGCVVGGVVLIIALLLLIFFVWRRRNSEDSSERRGNNSSHKGVSGPLSSNTSIPTHSLDNYSATAIYTVAQDQSHAPMYSFAKEPNIAFNSLAREPIADFYSEVEDLAEQPYLSLYSNGGFYTDIDKSNPGIYVNVTEPTKPAYSLVQKTNSSTHPVGSAFWPVNQPEFTNKIKADKEEEKVSALTRHQSVERPPEDDLVLRDNSLYVATENHSPNDAVDELTLTENDLYV